MTLSTKILLFLLAALLICTAGFVIYKQHEISARQDAIDKQMVAQKELQDNIVRSMAQWTTKADLEQFAKDNKINIDAIQKDLSSLNANLTAINVSVVKSSPQVANNLSSNSTVPNKNPDAVTVNCNGTSIECPNADPFGYRKNQQILKLHEQFDNVQVPFGDVGFSAWQDKPWNINILPREYSASTILGTDENSRTYVYNKFSVTVDGKAYDIKINKSDLKQVYPSSKFSFFNPRLYLGLDGGVNLKTISGTAGPNLTVQMMSYGQYLKQADFSILQLGLGYDIGERKPTAVIVPVSYNIGQHLPLMDNLYTGPSIQLNTSGDFLVGLGVHVAL